MTKEHLKGRRILVAEDEYLIADDLRTALTAAGAEVVGPYPTVSDTLKSLECDTGIDAAVLDVNLRGDMIFPVADLLRTRGVPFIFATGYDQWSLPDRFSDAVRLEKPLNPERVSQALGLTSHH
jgi:DNA-binding response OmpR family regulator